MQNKKLSFLRLISPAITAIFLLLIISEPVFSLTPREEAKLGREVLKKIKAHYGFLNCPEVVFYVRGLGKKIVSAIPDPSYSYRFFVLDQEIPNAFTIPGGYVFINWGLFKILKNEGELASIISHELAHAQARHIHRQIETQKALAIASLAAAIAGALLGTNPQLAQAIGTSAMAGAQTVALKYSREHEREADQIGLRYLEAAGYSPVDAVAAMKHLAARSWNVKPGVYDYLMTHPAIYERIDYMNLIISSQNIQKKASQNTHDLFPYAKVTLINKKEGLQGIHSIILDWEKTETASRTAKNFAKGLYFIDKGDFKRAEKLLLSSWSNYPANFFITLKLVELYFQQGKFKSAAKTLQTALSTNPENPILHYKYGIILQEMERYSEALYHLRIATKEAQLFPDLDYRMGTILGKLGKIGEAHELLGDYYFTQHNKALAKFHYTKALGIFNDPLLKKRIKKKLKKLKGLSDDNS